MKTILRQWICLVLCITIAAPMSAINAAEKTKSNYNEVIMGENHSFNGKLINSEGNAIEGASVKITQNGKVVAESATNKDGEFNIPGLKSGPYMVQAGKEAAMVRLWEKDMAPPTAKDKSTLVSGGAGKILRGQGADLITMVLIAGVATDIGLNIYQNNQINDLKDDVESLKAQLASP